MPENKELKRKSKMKCYWNTQLKIKFTPEEFEFLWGVYESIDNCMLCSKHFDSSFDKCLDHDHKTGEPRYILCRSCNNGYDISPRKNNKTGTRGIGESKYSWVFNFKYNGKTIRKKYAKSKYSLSDVIKIKNKKYCNNL